MAVTIGEACIRCGACEWECPDEAILPGAARPVVDVSRCTECYGSFGESQCIVVCPVGAIRVTVKENLAALAARFDRLHPGEPAQDTWIWSRIKAPSPNSG